MPTQHTVNLSPRQRWWLLVAIKSTVKPANRTEDRLLASVWNAFHLDAMQEDIDDGDKSRGPLDWSKVPEAIPCSRVDLDTLLGYLDLPSPSAEISLARIGVSNELLRAREAPLLESVPSGAGMP